jgi:hypothetical protein
VSGDVTTVIRPAAVVPEAAANAVVRALESLDVSKGGVWNASATVWQRYSGPWDGPGCTRGSAELIGTIAVAYEMPVRHHITLYRATVTAAGVERGWTVEQLCDEALGYGGLTLVACPRAELAAPPTTDPFRLRR